MGCWNLNFSLFLVLMGILDGTTPLAQLRYRDDTLPTDTSIAQVSRLQHCNTQADWHTRCLLQKRTEESVLECYATYAPHNIRRKPLERLTWTMRNHDNQQRSPLDSFLLVMRSTQRALGTGKSYPLSQTRIEPPQPVDGRSWCQQTLASLLDLTFTWVTRSGYHTRYCGKVKIKGASYDDRWARMVDWMNDGTS